MAKTPVDVLTFDVEDPRKASYLNFMSALRGKLAGKAGKNIRGHPILDGPQTGDNNPPPRWIHVVLSSGAVKPKVAIRSDNAYIVGFTNSQGDWFQLKKKEGQTKQILPNATVLGFSGDYEALVGDPIKNLPLLKLGMVKTVDAASVLWSHKKKKNNFADEYSDVVVDAITGFTINDPDKNLRKALATLAVTLCEAARLIPVHDVIADGWGSEQGVSVNVQQVQYIKKWGQLSEAMLGWAADGFKNDDKWFRHVKDSTGIDTGNKALEVVQLVLNNPPKKG